MHERKGSEHSNQSDRSYGHRESEDDLPRDGYDGHDFGAKAGAQVYVHVSNMSICVSHFQNKTHLGLTLFEQLHACTSEMRHMYTHFTSIHTHMNMR